MRNDPLSREGAPREYQEEMGDGPVVGTQRGGSRLMASALCFPKERGGKRVDDRKVLSGIIPVIQKGLP